MEKKKTLTTRRQAGPALAAALSLLLIFAITLPVTGQETSRIWTSGEHKVAATLVRVEGDKAVLKKDVDGAEIQVPLSILATEDQKHVEDFLAAESSPAETPAVAPTEVPAVTPTETQPEVPAEMPIETESPAAETTSAETTPAIGQPGELDLPPPNFPINPESDEFPDSGIHRIVLPEISINDSEIAALPAPLNRIAAAVIADSSQPDTLAALDEFRNNWSNAHATTLVRVLQKCSTSDDKFTRLGALEILGEHALDSNFNFILARLDDESYEIREKALSLISQKQDPRAIIPLVERFPGHDLTKISQVLESFGSEVEVPIHRYLNHDLVDVRLNVGRLLLRIGTERSIPAIEVAINGDPNAMVVLQMRAAVREISKRLAEGEAGASTVGRPGPDDSDNRSEAVNDDPLQVPPNGSQNEPVDGGQSDGGSSSGSPPADG